MTRVYFRGNRDQARDVAYRLRSILVGRQADSLGIARGVYTAIGFAALSDIKQDFVTKARGGTGEDGTRWPPLTREYLAYGRRFGQGEQARLKRAAGLGKQHRYAPGNQKGLLTAEQLKRWRKIYAQLLARLLVSLPPGQAKARAAAAAWAKLKAEGAQTKINVFGGRTVEILRDTGILFNSLSPGQIGGIGPGSTYSRPPLPGGEEQIFDVIRNGVIVGTNVPYAASHNFGDPRRGIPQRQFLPQVAPQVWTDRWAEVADQALLEGAKLAYEGAA